MRNVRLILVCLAMMIGIAGVGPASAQLLSKPDDALTPEEIAEREGRKACKVAICAAFHQKKAEGPDIACSVLKSWRKEQLQKMVERAKVSWPWGKVKCVADVRLKRADLVRAMTEATYVSEIGKHEVNCEVEQDGGPSKISFAFNPKVTFTNGKATKASLNWGAIEAPTLVKGAMWTATATDNTFNVLQSTLIEDINDFIGPKCDEVKDEWAKQ